MHRGSAGDGNGERSSGLRRILGKIGDYWGLSEEWVNLLGCLFFLLRVDHQTSFKIVCFGRLSGKGWLVDRWLAGGSGFANDDTLISIIYLLAAPIQHLLKST